MGMVPAPPAAQTPLQRRRRPRQAGCAPDRVTAGSGAGRDETASQQQRRSGRRSPAGAMSADRRRQTNRRTLPRWWLSAYSLNQPLNHACLVHHHAPRGDEGAAQQPDFQARDRPGRTRQHGPVSNPSRKPHYETDRGETPASACVRNFQHHQNRTEIVRRHRPTTGCAAAPSWVERRRVCGGTGTGQADQHELRMSRCNRRGRKVTSRLNMTGSWTDRREPRLHGAMLTDSLEGSRC